MSTAVILDWKDSTPKKIIDNAYSRIKQLEADNIRMSEALQTIAHPEKGSLYICHVCCCGELAAQALGEPLNEST